MLPGEVDALVRGVWEDVLDTKIEDDSADFFDIGGHSLMATRVISSLRRATGSKIPLRLIFDHPALRDFTAEVSKFLVEVSADAPS